MQGSFEYDGLEVGFGRECGFAEVGLVLQVVTAGPIGRQGEVDYCEEVVQNDYVRAAAEPEEG